MPDSNDPQYLAWLQSMFPSDQYGEGEMPAGFDPTAGTMPPAAAGPPGIAGLEGGWGHIPQDEMSFIQELLTPRNVQRSTQFSGGSHYGPDRNKSIPAENFAQAKALLEMMAGRDDYTRQKGINQQADTILNREAEGNRRPGIISGTFNGEDFSVDPGPNMSQGINPAEQLVIGASGVPVPGVTPGAGRTGGGSGSMQGGPNFKDVTARAKMHYENSQKLLDQISMLEPENPRIPDLKARAEAEFQAYQKLAYPQGQGAGGSDTAGTETPSTQYEPKGMLGTALDWWGEKFGDTGEAVVNAFIEGGRPVPTRQERDPSQMTEDQVRAALKQLSDYYAG